ncbi:MAG: vWA domain-containing protein [Planctomycetota bacterium]
MIFVHPQLLLLLIIPALLLVWGVRRRATGMSLPFDHRDHPKHYALNSTLRGFELVPAVLLAISIVLLARPQTLRVPTQERVLTNIQICLDVSGSMDWEGRYEMASSAIERFTRAREGDAIGITLFGSYQIRWAPLTRDLDIVRRALPFADPNNQPPGMSGTSIGAALRFCRDNMITEAEEGDKLIVLVSDGVSSDLGGSATDEVANLLVDAGIQLFHVHVGSDSVPSDVADIAEQTGGDAFVATDEAGLQRVFAHIDAMRPERFRPVSSVPADDTSLIALFGLALLGLHTFASLGMRYTPW